MEHNEQGCDSLRDVPDTSHTLGGFPHQEVPVRQVGISNPKYGKGQVPHVDYSTGQYWANILMLAALNEVYFRSGRHKNHAIYFGNMYECMVYNQRKVLLVS